MRNTAVILSGGKGLRMGGDRPKQFLSIAGIPIIVHTLRAFLSHPQIGRIVLVANPDYIDTLKEILNRHDLKIDSIIGGGKSRQLSVYNALTAVEYGDDEIVLLHDGVRPFISHEHITASIQGAEEHGAAVVCSKTTDTIYITENGLISQIPDRKRLYNAQTPQTFRYSLIYGAHRRAIDKGIHDYSDDIGLIMQSGVHAKVIEGSDHNIKITTPKDIGLGEAILNSREK